MTYSLQYIADEMNMSLKTIRRFVASKELKTTKVNNTYTVSEEDFKEFKKYIENGGDKKHRDSVAEGFLDFGDNEDNKQDNHKPHWTDISAYWQQTSKSDMTFVDLFCGAGGLSKGLELAGLEGICGLDFFEEACRTYNRNFNHPFVNGDIRSEHTKKEFYDVVRRQLAGRHLDIVAGGFPCQGFSMAGNRIVDDPRNSLYKELIEVVQELHPDFVICENVKGLRTMLGGKVEQKILADFQSIGYQMNVETLCAADYYTPQKRERVIFIGNRIGVKNLHPAPLLAPKDYVTTGEAIADLMNHPADSAFNHEPTRHRPDMAQRIMEHQKERVCTKAIVTRGKNVLGMSRRVQ